MLSRTLGSARLTAKLEEKLVSVASAIAWPLTLSGKISLTMSQEMGPKLTCGTHGRVEVCVSVLRHSWQDGRGVRGLGKDFRLF